MLIDWFTVVAQVVNFLLLLYLLKRFLYAPIQRAMDKRERMISERLDAAENARAEAEKNAEEYQKKRNRLEEQSAQLMAQAEAAAEQHGKQLIAQAQVETEGLRNSWSEAVQREQALFLGELKKRAGAEILRISRKSTAELTGVDLQPNLADVLLKKLQELPQADKDKCVEAATKVVPKVRSAFALETQLETKITSALQALCGVDVQVAYSIDPEMPFGIEVTIGELRFSWGIEGYFKDLEQNVADFFGQSVRLTSASVGAQGDG